MATVSDLSNTPLSSLNHIDALLDVGPDWNYMTPAGNTIYYTFSVTSGNEEGKSGQEAFTLSQQNFARQALVQELGRITGIRFVETTDGGAAQLHFCNIDISGSSTTGLCSWNTHYSYDTSDNLVSYEADAYVYLDNAEWYAQNRNLTPGGSGYETLLHELGHALGLKHPFDDDVHLPSGQDNTGYTLMSYSRAGGPYQHFSQYDVAALNWLYGGDGLRGDLGINSATGARYLTGTNSADSLVGADFNDTLEGAGGNDFLDGGEGIDTAVFRGARGDYTITQLESNMLIVAGDGFEGVDTLSSIEILRFSDGSFARAQVAPPSAPTLNVAKTTAGYATLGKSALVTGSAEPNTTVRIYINDAEAGSVTVDGSGLWSLATPPLKDGTGYLIYAIASNDAGNTSKASQTLSFNVDATPPVIPWGTVDLEPNSNKPVFSGLGEAGTTIQLVRVTDASEIGRATVGIEGSWKLTSVALPDGDYRISVVSMDLADNATSSSEQLSFKVASSLNMTGTAQADSFEPGEGSNAIDGKGGMDVAVYSGARSNYTVTKNLFGYTVANNSLKPGQDQDTLVNVERIKFGDNKWLALDVNGTAGQVYRLYQAAFDRTPDAGGFAYWLDSVEKQGFTLGQVANLFTKSQEFSSMYMSDPSDQFFIKQLYAHVLHRQPDAAGLEWWLSNIHASSRAEVLALFSESPENQAQVIGTIQNGLEFTPWG